MQDAIFHAITNYIPSKIGQFPKIELRNKNRTISKSDNKKITQFPVQWNPDYDIQPDLNG